MRCIVWWPISRTQSKRPISILSCSRSQISSFSLSTDDKRSYSVISDSSTYRATPPPILSLRSRQNRSYFSRVYKVSGSYAFHHVSQTQTKRGSDLKVRTRCCRSSILLKRLLAFKERNVRSFDFSSIVRFKRDQFFCTIVAPLQYESVAYDSYKPWLSTRVISDKKFVSTEISYFTLLTQLSKSGHLFLSFSLLSGC